MFNSLNEPSRSTLGHYCLSVTDAIMQDFLILDRCGREPTLTIGSP
jgi:hypothetical protein